MKRGHCVWSSFEEQKKTSWSAMNLVIDIS